jgi:branched-chain amino acid transport system ATP-binding protein
MSAPAGVQPGDGPGDTPRPALVLTDLTVRRAGRDVVHGVSLEVPAGAVTALLGPNGAGKSSLVLALCGVLRPTSGSVRLGDRELVGLRPERIRQAGLATAPEGHRVLGDLTVLDNLRVAGARLDRRHRAAGLDRVLGLFPELRDLAGRRGSRLSGGEQQMLALAQALLDQPRYLVIDELSLGLAPVVVRRLAPTLSAIAAAGTGVLLIEQFTHVALSVATRASVLVRGRIRLTDTAANLRADPDRLRSAYHLGSPQRADQH